MKQFLRRYSTELKLQNVRGTHDLLPQSQELQTFEFIVEKAKSTAKQYLYQPIHTPILEYKDVFHRTLGTESDVVSKEMFSAVPLLSQHQSEDTIVENVICLRPEMTASVARSIIQHNLYSNLPHRLYYMGPMFRMERPQKGRYRQFHQFGVENIGSSSYQTDIEIIQMAHQFLQSIGLYKDPNSIVLEINTLGSTEDRVKYRSLLLQYLETRKSELSYYSRQKLERGSVLKVLDSKEPVDAHIVKDAPKLLEVVCEESLKHFEKITQALTQCNIPHVISPYLVRGLDYYCHTTFEFKTTQIGSKNTVLGGGRYDNLLETMGGKPLPAIGWACGIERLMHAVQYDTMVKPSLKKPCIIMVAKVKSTESEQEVLEKETLQLTHLLRSHFAKLESADVAVVGYDKANNIKKQFEYADMIGATYVVLLGKNELDSNSVKVKNMIQREEVTLQRDQLLQYFDKERNEK